MSVSEHSVSSVDEAVRAIATQGYCVLPGAFAREDTERALALVRHWNAETEAEITTALPRMAKDPVVWNLQNKDFAFLELLFAHEDVTRILVRCLNDRWYRAIEADHPNYILRAYVARSGLGPLPLHIDSFIPYRGEHIQSMQYSILLEEMTTENGCTLVVPGSHLSGEYVDQSALSDAVPIEASAGDVILWDSRIWHGARENPAERSRWMLIATLTRWWIKQAFRIPETLPREYYDRLSPEQRAVLGYCSIPYATEQDGIVMQRGYETAEPHPDARGKS